MQRIGLWVAAAAMSCAGVGMAGAEPGARGGGAGGGDGSVLNCDAGVKECRVPVTASAAKVGQNDCGVGVADIVHLQAPNHTQVRWALAQASDGGVSFRFAADGIVIANNVGGDNKEAFKRRMTSAGPEQLHDIGKPRSKTPYSYSIRMQWSKVAEKWSNCNVVDPRIVNDGP